MIITGAVMPLSGTTLMVIRELYWSSLMRAFGSRWRTLKLWTQVDAVTHIGYTCQLNLCHALPSRKWMRLTTPCIHWFNHEDTTYMPSRNTVAFSHGANGLAKLVYESSLGSWWEFPVIQKPGINTNNNLWGSWDALPLPLLWPLVAQAHTWPQQGYSLWRPAIHLQIHLPARKSPGAVTASPPLCRSFWQILFDQVRPGNSWGAEFQSTVTLQFPVANRSTNNWYDLVCSRRKGQRKLNLKSHNHKQTYQDIEGSMVAIND